MRDELEENKSLVTKLRSEVSTCSKTINIFIASLLGCQFIGKGSPRNPQKTDPHGQ